MADTKGGEGDLILVVDDAYPMRRIIQTYLEAVGFKVIMAERVAEGLALARKTPPALIISDWMMPEATGIKLVSLLREDAELKHIPVIICTAKGSKEDVVEAMERGVSDFIRKPFTKAVLIEKVRKLIPGKVPPAPGPAVPPPPKTPTPPV